MNVFGFIFLFHLDVIVNFLPATVNLIPNVNMRLQIRLSQAKFKTNVLVLPDEIISKAVFSQFQVLIHEIELVEADFIGYFVLLFF